MTTSQSPKVAHIFTSMNAIMQELRPVGKDGYNQAQKYNFRSAEGVINEISPLLAKHGVVIEVLGDSIEYVNVQVGEKRTNQCSVRVKVTYRFRDISDESAIMSTVFAESMDSGDKATSKAMTVAYRTCLIQTFCLPTGEPDPDEHTVERSPKIVHSASDLLKAFTETTDLDLLTKIGLWLKDNADEFEADVIENLRAEYVNAVTRLAKSGKGTRKESPSKLDENRGASFQDEFASDQQE